jgi:sugar/nucleoside kinase (ribokinase family)
VSPPDLVVFGHLLTDDIVFEDGSTRLGEAGGAALYFSLGAALWGLRVGVVSRCGAEYPRAMLGALEERGILLDGVRFLDGPGMRNWLLYEGRIRHIVHHLASPPLADVTPRAAELPARWREARAYHVAPMPHVIQSELVHDLERTNGAILSLDPYVLLTAETWETGQRLAGAVDVFLLSADEFLVECDRDDPTPTLDTLWNGRLGHLALKQGASGGWLRDAEGWRRWRTKTEAAVVDATGAGDCFAAGFLAGRLAGESSECCLQRGIVTASFAIGDWGVRGLLAATPGEAAARLARWFEH